LLGSPNESDRGLRSQKVELDRDEGTATAQCHDPRTKSRGATDHPEILMTLLVQVNKDFQENIL